MNDEALSKEVSYALRHAPWEYELELDDEGWVSIEQLLASFRTNRQWERLTVQDLARMIGASDKKRHEIRGDQIRALYGHSIANKIVREEKEPPEVLYHGTANRFVDAIKQHGLQPQARQYVHLSADVDTAVQVGKRRDGEPKLLAIRAKEGYAQGVKFYYGNDKVWLADAVPAKYIDF